MKLPSAQITNRQLEEWFTESGCVRRRFCPPKVPAPPAGEEFFVNEPSTETDESPSVREPSTGTGKSPSANEPFSTGTSKSPSARGSFSAGTGEAPSVGGPFSTGKKGGVWPDNRDPQTFLKETEKPLSPQLKEEAGF